MPAHSNTCMQCRQLCSKHASDHDQDMLPVQPIFRVTALQTPLDRHAEG